jgi:hypothetical protein
MTKHADSSRFSKTTVHRILNEANVKPHEIDQWCGKSPDPDLKQSKQMDILGLYLSPPDNAFVISVDEKSQIQALDRTRPMLPMRPNRERRQTHTYTRRGTTYLSPTGKHYESAVSKYKIVEHPTSSDRCKLIQHFRRDWMMRSKGGRQRAKLDNLIAQRPQYARHAGVDFISFWS